jgi:hypothetical protein
MQMQNECGEFVVHMIGGEDDETATISCNRHDTVCQISLRFRDQTLRAEAQDFFAAFCELRKELEKTNLIPFCYGASLNVYPSGMCRDMGQGLLAYRMTKGVRPSQEDLARIFDEGPDVIPATVSLQQEFYNEWLTSIGVKNNRDS